MAIKSFNDKETAKIFDGRFSKKIPQSIQERAMSQLDMIDAAIALSNLTLPGLRLEALKGDRKGQHSIRINRQWRICFTWKSDGAHDVETTDFH